MSVTAAARRYAEALADVAVARGQTAVIDEDLSGFARMFSSSAELVETFASPVVPQRDKQKVLSAILERTCPSSTTANLLKLLLRNYRLQHLEVVYREFRKELDKREGLVAAEVTSAAPIGPAEQKSLARQLERMTGKRVKIEFKLDQSLIGGAVARIGSVVYDGSIRTRLDQIKLELKQEGTT